MLLVLDDLVALKVFSVLRRQVIFTEQVSSIGNRLDVGYREVHAKPFVTPPLIALCQIEVFQKLIMRKINNILTKLEKLKSDSISVNGYFIKSILEFASRAELDGIAPTIVYCDFEGFRIEFSQQEGFSQWDSDTLCVKVIPNNSLSILKEKRLADIQIVMDIFKNSLLKDELKEAKFDMHTE